MPGITIDVNDIRIATIDLTGIQVMDVSVSGAFDTDPKADLTASGGNYEDGGCGHLIWITEHVLLTGEILCVGLTEISGIADQGKTIAELYPDEPACEQTDFTISADMAAEIRARPRLHKAFIVQAGHHQVNGQWRPAMNATPASRSGCYGIATFPTRPASVCGPTASTT